MPDTRLSFDASPTKRAISLNLSPTCEHGLAMRNAELSEKCWMKTAQH